LIISALELIPQKMYQNTLLPKALEFI